MITEGLDQSAIIYYGMLSGNSDFSYTDPDDRVFRFLNSADTGWLYIYLNGDLFQKIPHYELSDYSRHYKFRYVLEKSPYTLGKWVNDLLNMLEGMQNDNTRPNITTDTWFSRLARFVHARKRNNAV